MISVNKIYYELWVDYEYIKMFDSKEEAINEAKKYIDIKFKVEVKKVETIWRLERGE